MLSNKWPKLTSAPRRLRNLASRYDGSIKMSLKIVFIIVIVAFVTNVRAGVTSYGCTILSESSLDQNGQLIQHDQVLSLNAVFMVDRSSGNVVTPDSVGWLYKDSRVNLLSVGNKDSSFQAIYTAPAANNGVHTTYIRIEEFLDLQDKPFIVLSGSTVQTGKCK